MSNPYTTPEAAISMPPGLPGNLASRLQRFGAALIDAIIVGGAGVIVQKFIWSGPSDVEIQEAVRKGKSVMEIAQMATPPMTTLLLLSLIQIAIMIGINFAFLKNGQTIGKKVIGLQVRRRDSDEVLPQQEYITKRLLPIYGAALVLQAIHPFLGALLIIDSLLIFRPGRNTLHDDIAKSKVVKL